MSNIDKEAAILVDYDLYRTSSAVRKWVRNREYKASLVMLVNNPQYFDYDPESPLNKGEAEFPVVLRNTGATPNLVFKTSALCVLQDMSNLIPVVSLDRDWQVQQMMRDGGVIVTLYEKDLHYDE